MLSYEQRNRVLKKKHLKLVNVTESHIWSTNNSGKKTFLSITEE